jgi:ribokinase
LPAPPDSKPWDVVVVGGCNTDYLVRGARLPAAGETAQGDVFDEAPGGKGANQAIAAARLGCRVALIGRVGDDAQGTRFFERLREETVDTRRLRRDPEAGTGVALVMVDQNGEKQILAAPRANARVSPADVRDAASLIESASVLLLQLETSVEVVQEAVGIARRAGVQVVLDPAPPRELPDSLLAQLDVIRPNAGEATALTGVDVRDFESARAAALVLRRRGVKTAVVGAADDGDLLLSPEEEIRLPRFPVKAVDATGAGDAFAAAIAAARARGLGWRDTGLLAAAAAALKTTKLGAQAGLPSLGAVLSFLRERGVGINDLERAHRSAPAAR